MMQSEKTDPKKKQQEEPKLPRQLPPPTPEDREREWQIASEYPTETLAHEWR